MKRVPSPAGARRAAKRPAARSLAHSRQIQQDMAQELFMIVRRALSRYGVSAGLQKQALRRALRPGTVPNASGRVHRSMKEMGELLSFWRYDAGHVGPDGAPRTLPIRGPGISFESLVRRFLPGVPVSTALKLFLGRSEVTPRLGGRIALTGSSTVRAKSRRESLAMAIRHVDYVLRAVQEGFGKRGDFDSGKGFDRILTAVIPKDMYEQAVRRLRPEIHDLLERTDATLLRDSQGQESKDACALILGTYVVRTDDLGRLDGSRAASRHRSRAARAVRQARRVASATSAAAGNAVA
jgi:hypothetical protein